MSKEITSRTFTSTDGVISTWYYEDKKLTKVSIKYPDNYTSEFEDTKKQNKKLPKTKQKYLNPANGKYVGYNRAVQLGLIK